jgi:hypothetical protein
MDDLNIESEGLNIEGLNSANINKDGAVKWLHKSLPSKIIYLSCEWPDELNSHPN